MRIITNEELKATNRAFYAAGLLSAQHEFPRCKLVFDYTNCAIGAVMTASEIEESCSINQSDTHNLQSARIVIFEDVQFASRLQGAHDSWAMERANGTIEYENKAEEKFLALIAE